MKMELGNEDLDSKINNVRKRGRGVRGGRGKKRGVEKMNLSALVDTFQLDTVVNDSSQHTKLPSPTSEKQDKSDEVNRILSDINEIEIGEHEMENLRELMDNDEKEHESVKNNRSTSTRSSKRWSQEDQAIVLTDNEIDDAKDSKNVDDELEDVQPFAFDLIANEEFNYLIKNNSTEQFPSQSHSHKNEEHSHSYSRNDEDEKHHKNSKKERKHEYDDDESDHDRHKQDEHYDPHDEEKEYDRKREKERDEEKEYERKREKEHDEENELELKRELDWGKEREHDHDKSADYDGYHSSSHHRDSHHQNSHHDYETDTHKHDDDTDDNERYIRDMNKKRYLLGEIELLKPKYGNMMGDRDYTLNDKLHEIEDIFGKMDKRNRIDKQIEEQKSSLIIMVKGVEYLNLFFRYMTGKGLYIDGWADTLALEMEKHDDLMEEFCQKHGSVISIPIEFKLGFIILSSGFAYHMNRAELQSPQSDLTNEVLNSDPELKSRFSEQYNKRLAEMKNNPNMSPTQPQASGIAGMMTNMLNGFFGGGDNKRESTGKQQVQMPDMKRPQGMDDMVNNLKEETDVADISFTTRP